VTVGEFDASEEEKMREKGGMGWERDVWMGMCRRAEAGGGTVVPNTPGESLFVS
jgi:hypothetical protein